MKTRIALLTLTMFLTALAHAGVVIEFANRNAETGKEEPLQSMWVQNGMARMEATGKRSSVTIFKDDALYVVNADAKSYQVIDKAALEQAAAMMDDAMAKMREKMATIPPEQRAMVEQMMKQRGGAVMGGASGPQKSVVYDAQPTGGTETINGKSCKLWNVTRDGVLSQQLCVVPLSSMGGADEVIALSKKMSTLFEKFGERMRDQMGTGMQQPNSALAKINGYPILSRAYHDGQLSKEEFVVKTWTQKTIEPAKFEIPAGYAKQDMPKMGGK